MYKLRPFIKLLQCKIPMGEKVCVDKKIILFNGRRSINQYIKQTPKKWECKSFVLYGSDGIVYNWELYSGTLDHDPDLPDLGIEMSSYIMKNNSQK